jgi:threonine dehydrogenase-like Zn-dependent dehydrogenase
MIDPALGPRWDYARRRELVVSLLAELPLAGLITHRVPFSQAADAYRLVDTQSEQVLQVVLDYGEA